jgi:hypothetical protein
MNTYLVHDMHADTFLNDAVVAHFQRRHLQKKQKPETRTRSYGPTTDGSRSLLPNAHVRAKSAFWCYSLFETSSFFPFSTSTNFRHSLIISVPFTFMYSMYGLLQHDVKDQRAHGSGTIRGTRTPFLQK